MIQIAPKTYHPIQRQNGSNSRQPRFQEVAPRNFFTSLFRFANTDIQEEPGYGSRERDTWLRQVWKLEPYMAGVINSTTSIDKNRGWTITGGRNQVRRFVKILHNRFFFAPDLFGWRASFGGSAQSYYTSDIGSVTEVERIGSPEGPLNGLYFVDPSRTYLTGNPVSPLRYSTSGRGNYQDWGLNDYFRVVSLPDTDENLYGLGFCALSRAIELVKIMVGIYQYDNEMLLNRAPRGLLLLKGITEEQWDDSMSARTARLDGDEKKYYGAVHVLAAIDPGIELDAKLVTLSSLPAEFDQKTFTDLLMYGYALIFGYDPREFWPVSGGTLGTAAETEAQHRKGGAKGGLDFVLGFAEKLQAELPDTIQFEFEERDLDGELRNAEVEQAQADVVTGIYGRGPQQQGEPLIDREEGRILLAKKGLIDPDWTIEEEPVTATDTEDDISRSLANERVQKAIWKYPDEPIVRYRFSVENGKERHDFKTLLSPLRTRRRSFLITRTVERQIESELDDYQNQIDELAEQANEGEINQDEFQETLMALTLAILILAMLRGTEGSEGDPEAVELLIDAALLILEDGSPEAIEAGLQILTDQEILADALPSDALALLQEEIDGSLASTLPEDVSSGQFQDNAEGLLSRLAMWGITATGLYLFGQWTGHPDQLYIWKRGPTLDPCDDCLRLDEQVHSGAEWAASGWRPKGRNLKCTGRYCLCGTFPTDLVASGNF